MRVLHVTRDFPPRRNGGLSTAVAGLVEATPCPTAVLSFDAWRPRGKSKPTLRDTDDVARLASPRDLPKARRFAETFAPTHVHVHHAMLFPFAASLGAPTVLSIHVVQRELRRLRDLPSPTQSEQAQAAAVARADRVIVPSRAARDALGAGEVVPLGVAPTPLPRFGGEGALFVGRFADVKGLGTLADALPHLRTPVSIAGGLPDSPRAVRKWRARLRGAKHIGWLDAERLDAAYAAHAILVAPSWTESFGQAALEAQMRGLAVVASDAGALPERVRDGVDGVLVPPREPEALAEALDALAGDASRLASMRRAARAHAETQTWDRRIEAHLDVYRALR